MNKKFEVFLDTAARDFILDVMDEAICIVDNDGIVHVWNEKSEKIYDVKKAELIGKKMDSVLKDTVIIKVLESGEDMENIYQSTRTGCSILVNAKIIYIDGEKVGALCVDKDLSEIDRLNIQVDKLKDKINYLEIQRKAEMNKSTMIAGNSIQMEELMYKAGKVAKTDTPLMILGESGVGKKALARRIHEMSQRKGPFVHVNCGAIPNEIFESEFFGSTDINTGKNRPGLFEIVDQGTIFLGEITDMPINMQAKLLNLMQKNEIVRASDGKHIKINTRIISGTNKNIEEMIEEGTFLEELYYSLNVIELIVASLRERKSDIPLLADLFMKEMCDKYNLEIPKLDSEVVDILMQYSWKGNIRELQNVIEHVVVMSGGKTITTDMLPISIKESVKTYMRANIQVNDLAKSVGEFERDIIENIMKKSDWNKSEAARMLNIPRTTLIYKIDLYGIKDKKERKTKKSKTV
ncbi:sigma-54-dependent Fis family transcriptional regulator [Proteocatella sphenisci]|uniref:sigma-54-dependent Fis family transcriptional regulator n=1 Tax=Proteocatella sphenisci TaxID=181070 RepID=UPI0004BCBB6B|nr:sigma-54-dependent Fis family transcriptional regulator [Proteocatella sphenisci]